MKLILPTMAVALMTERYIPLEHGESIKRGTTKFHLVSQNTPGMSVCNLVLGFSNFQFQVHRPIEELSEQQVCKKCFAALIREGGWYGE